MLTCCKRVEGLRQAPQECVRGDAEVEYLANVRP